MYELISIREDSLGPGKKEINNFKDYSAMTEMRILKSNSDNSYIKY